MASLLLVHNDSDDRAMYGEYLRAHGFDVREVGTTDEAILLIGDVDALITGLLVAGTIAPLDFISRIRATSSSLPIVVVTACVYNDRIAKAEQAGADVVLLKPCLPDQLLSELRSVMDAAPVRLVSRKVDRRVP